MVSDLGLLCNWCWGCLGWCRLWVVFRVVLELGFGVVLSIGLFRVGVGFFRVLAL